MNNSGLTDRIDDRIQDKQEYGDNKDDIHKVIFTDLFDKKLSDLPYIQTIFIFVGNERIEVENDNKDDDQRMKKRGQKR